MKICVIIPLYNQSKYWNKLLLGLSRQSVSPDVIYVVVDRPNDDKGQLNESGEPVYEDWDCIKEIESENTKFPTLNIQIRSFYNPPSNVNRNSDSNLFLAGMARNIGLESAIRDKCDIFIFIDGDCIPENDLVKSHINKCISHIPVLSVGRRKELQYRWMDQREVIASISHLNLFRRDGVVINSNELIKNCLVVWSCNIALNLTAVNIIKKLNVRYYDRDELFHSAFLGAWGGEDSFLGVQAWACRVFITTVGDPRSGVHHINHPRPSSTHSIDHKEFFIKQCDDMKNKMKIRPLDMIFFTQH